MYAAVSLAEYSTGASITRWLGVFDLLSIEIDVLLRVTELSHTASAGMPSSPSAPSTSTTPVLDATLGSYSLSILFRERHADDGDRGSPKKKAASGTKSLPFQDPGTFFSGGAAGSHQRDAVRFVSSLSAYLPRSSEMIKQGSIALSAQEFEGFVLGACAMLSSLGVVMELPAGMHALLSKPKAVLLASRRRTANVDPDLEDGRVVGHVNLEGLCEFDAKIAVGQTLMSLEEFEELVKRAAGKKIVKVGGELVHLGADEVRGHRGGCRV